MSMSVRCRKVLATAQLSSWGREGLWVEGASADGWAQHLPTSSQYGDQLLKIPPYSLDLILYTLHLSVCQMFILFWCLAQWNKARKLETAHPTIKVGIVLINVFSRLFSVRSSECTNLLFLPLQGFSRWFGARTYSLKTSFASFCLSRIQIKTVLPSSAISFFNYL